MQILDHAKHLRRCKNQTKPSDCKQEIQDKQIAESNATADFPITQSIIEPWDQGLS